MAGWYLGEQISTITMLPGFKFQLKLNYRIAGIPEQRFRAHSCHPIEFFEGPLPRPKQQVSCKSLGVTEQTLKKYIKAEGAPRAMMLALFWEMRCGRSAADTEAANFGAIYYRKAMGLERENVASRKKMQAMQLELDRQIHESANSPFFDVG